MTTTRPTAEELCEAILSRFDDPPENYCMATRTLIELAQKFRAAPASNSVTIELPDPPKGYDYKRDASGRVCVEKPNGRPWLDIYGCVSHGTPSEGLMFVDGSRPILVKQQERVFMDFKAAVEAIAHGDKTVYLDGRPWAGPDNTFGPMAILNAIDRTDFYVADAAGGT